VFRRPGAGEVAASADDGAPAAPGETTNTIVHVSTIPLPPGTADFASDAVEHLGADDVLVVLFEYDPASVQQPLFASRGMPRALDPDDFSPNALQRSLRGQAGLQRFFQEAGRAFCLYVVLGSFARRQQLVDAVNGVLATVALGSLTPAATTVPPPPQPDILATIADSPDLSTLAGLVASGGVHALLAGTGPFTVFAPDDDAFAAIDLASLRADPMRLDRTLQHHVVLGRLSIAELATMSSVTPVVGDALSITVAGGGRVLVGGAPVVRPDLNAANGYVHVVTGVLELPR
jgi:uncharacterized surface protein with fasciclin (FAS1) repeats